MPAYCAHVSGEIDCASAPAYASTLAAAARDHEGDVLVDVAAVTFADSTMVRVTLEARARLAESGRRLRIVNASDALVRLFEITGVDDMLEGQPSGI